MCRWALAGRRWAGGTQRGSPDYPATFAITWQHPTGTTVEGTRQSVGALPQTWGYQRLCVGFAGPTLMSGCPPGASEPPGPNKAGPQAPHLVRGHSPASAVVPRSPKWPRDATGVGMSAPGPQELLGGHYGLHIAMGSRGIDRGGQVGKKAGGQEGNQTAQVSCDPHPQVHSPRPQPSPQRATPTPKTGSVAQLPFRWVREEPEPFGWLPWSCTRITTESHRHTHPWTVAHPSPLQPNSQYPWLPQHSLDPDPLWSPQDCPYPRYL